MFYKNQISTFIINILVANFRLTNISIQQCVVKFRNLKVKNKNKFKGLRRCTSFSYLSVCVQLPILRTQSCMIFRCFDCVFEAQINLEMQTAASIISILSCILLVVPMCSGLVRSREIDCLLLVALYSHSHRL